MAQNPHDVIIRVMIGHRTFCHLDTSDVIDDKMSFVHKRNHGEETNAIPSGTQISTRRATPRLFIAFYFNLTPL
jgi:hypothetical protein